MKRLGSLRQCLFHGGHHGILLIFHLQKTKSLVAGNFIFRNNAGDVISVNPDSLIQKLSVTDILVGFLYRPGVSCCGELNIRHIKAGKNLYDSRYLLRLTGINALYQTISDGGMVNLTVQNILRLQVRSILCFACDFSIGINTNLIFPYCTHGNPPDCLQMHPLVTKIQGLLPPEWLCLSIKFPISGVYSQFLPSFFGASVIDLTKIFFR